MSTSIVTTTIHVPELLTGYCENAKRFGHKDVDFIVIGDKKSPTGVADFCRGLEHKYGFAVEYLDVPQQLSYLKTWPNLRDHLPFNSIQRRNIGLLKAYQDGAEVVITIDDDNFVLSDQDYIGRHGIVGREVSFTCLESSAGWFNVCEMLQEQEGISFYHRGFAMEARKLSGQIVVKPQRGKVVVNAGLWTDAPDVDALTWLTKPVRVVKMHESYGQGVGLAHGTWSPFNSQNTALAREVIPAYFLSPYIGRYDDIWASYVVKRIADHMGDYVHFGVPLVKQDRNEHNYWHDFDKERLGMELSDSFVAMLQSLALQGQDYASCLGEVIEGMKEYTEKNDLARYRQGLQIWQSVFSLEKSIVPVVEKRRLKLNLGSGSRPLPGFVNVDSRDIEGIEFPNMQVDKLDSFQSGSADYIYACHVLEHLPREKTFPALLEWNRVLKTGGMLRVAVPDWDAIVAYYRKTGDLTNLLNFLFGGREDPDNAHCRVFNFEVLRALLWEAGFKRIARYDWRETDHADHDDFSKAYMPHLDTESGLLMSLNVECVKHTNVQESADLTARGW